ncbi:MAG: glycosyltransferase family 4 protein [Firmicutes bacterium]|nr:glycosyltransferase family 4 protein [Bacillota bacterium]
MQILMLSIFAKCGVFTHVRDLAVYLQKLGLNPVIGFIDNKKCRKKFALSSEDRTAMIKTLDNVPFFFFATAGELKKQLKRQKPNLIHAHSPFVLNFGQELAEQLKVPYVITLHGVLAWAKRYRAPINAADMIIAVGTETAKSLGRAYRYKSKVIFNGIDLNYFRPPLQRDFTGPLRVLWLGRVSGKAALGVECLSEAVGRLRREGIAVEAKAIGNVGGAKITNLEYCGWVHDLLPALQWGQVAFARGRALREAMACGNAGFLLAQGYGGPVTAELFGGKQLPLLSGERKHGAEKLNPVRIAEDLKKLHYNRHLLAEKCLEARQIAKKHFDVEKMVKETLFVYEEAVKRKRKKLNKENFLACK